MVAITNPPRGDGRVGIDEIDSPAIMPGGNKEGEKMEKDTKLIREYEGTSLRYSDGGGQWPGYTNNPLKRGYWYGRHSHHVWVGMSLKTAMDYMAGLGLR